MATTVKQNAVKKETVTSKTAVKKKLTEEAKANVTSANGVQTQKATPEINLDERIQKFEKLRGLATKRERLVQTLSEITKFNYNQGDSSSFYLRDAHGNEFKTTNNNLIKLVSSHLQSTLESRKKELETEILAFEL